MFRTALDKSHQFNQSLRQWAGGLPTYARNGLLAALGLLVLALALLAAPLRPARVQAAAIAPMTPAQTPPLVCNGFAYLCDRRYDQVSYATTHNAHSIWPYIRVAFNQYRSLRQQLDDGVRGMMLDVHAGGGGRLCHADCNNGYIPLSTGLSAIRGFLETHPNEVLTLILEAQDNVGPNFTVQAFQAAGLERYAYTYHGNQWPTLRQMINSNKRLVVFTSGLDDREHPNVELSPHHPSSGGYLYAPWLHCEWQRASETPYSYAIWAGAARGFGEDRPGYCEPDRGTPNGLFVLNHFITPANYSAASVVNELNYIRPSARYCQAWRNRLPNFVTVDFEQYGEGGFMTTVNELNRTGLVCPDDLVVDVEAGAPGAFVTYPALSADGGGTAMPPSGSFFPINTTTVVNARREYGFSTEGQQLLQTCQFKVTVRIRPGLTLTSNQPNPALPQELVTFNYQLIVGPGQPIPTGTVRIDSGNDSICTGNLSQTIFGGAAGSCQGRFSSEGDRPVRAFYAGNPPYLAAFSDTVVQVVRRFPTTATITSSANPLVFNQPLTLTATVNGTAPGGQKPSGLVEFSFDDLLLVEVPLVNGVARYVWQTPYLGERPITARYKGDSFFGESTDGLFQTVICYPITLTPETLALANGTVLTPYRQQMTRTGFPPNDSLIYLAGISYLPPGLTLDNLSGLISGTPEAVGSYAFGLGVSDLASNCRLERPYTINIACPTITLATLPNAQVGAPYNQAATAAPTGGNYGYDVTAGSLPPGLTLNATTGAVSGTPTQLGTFNFTIKATGFKAVTGLPDEVGNYSFVNGACNGSRAYSLTVNPTGGGNAGLQFYPLTKPLRLLDTRAGQQGCDAPGTPILGGTARTQLARRTCNGSTIPANARAVTGNITTVQSGGGYLTLYPSDVAQPLVANTNFAPNEVLNNVFTVGLGNTDGSFKIFATSDTHVVVDVTGYYAPPTPTGLYFHPLPKPIRLLETRAGLNGAFTPGVKLPGNQDTPQQAWVSYDGVTIPNTAQALVGNATTVNNGAGYLTLYPGGVSRPLVASSNFGAGQVMNAPFTVGLSATGEFMIFTTAETDLVIDVLGYYSLEANDGNGTGLFFNPLGTPVRLLETRAGLNGCYAPNAPLAAGSVRSQQARGACGSATIPNAALAIVGNATVVNNQAGYLTCWPKGAAQPLVATTNFTTGQVLNRHFTVGLGTAGEFNIFAFAQTDLIIDVAGFFAP